MEWTKTGAEGHILRSFSRRMGQMAAARVIDLNAYRAQRAQVQAPIQQPMPMMQMSYVFVAYWTYVPVMLVPGH
jgi:hypothetical protein